MNFVPLAFYAAALIAYAIHFTRRQPAVGRTATTLLVFAALVHTFVIGMQTMDVGHIPFADASAFTNTFVLLLALSYLYVEMTTDERAMGIFILPMLAALQSIPALKPGHEERAALLSGPLFNLHVSSLLFAYASFALACVIGITYVLLFTEIKADHDAAPGANPGRRGCLSDARRAAAVRHGLRHHGRRPRHGDRAAVDVRVHRAHAAASVRVRIGIVGHGVPVDVRLRARLGPRARTVAGWRSGVTTARLRMAAAIGLLGLLLVPIYWMIISSLTPEARLFEAPHLVPRTITFAHYRALFAERQFLVPIRNSFVVAALTTVLAVPVAASCAYAFARLTLRGRGLLLALMLSVSMFPQISIVPPLFLVLRALGLLDTYPGLVLPYVTFSMPLAVWLLTGFFRQLPPDLEEAALLDGASRLRTLVDVVLPLAAPGVATAAILTFLYSWNEFLFALSFTLGPERQTVPVAVTLFRGRYQVPWGQVLAATVVATIPVAILVAAFQRRIVAGLTSGASKG